MSEPIISARDVRRSFTLGSRRIEVLRGISLDIEAGESIFLVGASGAGKTTLLYTLAGLERPESGSVTLGRGAECEVKIDDPSISRRHVALHLGPTITVEELGSHNGT
ncbi:MAG: ATP-binding cassette domain-containing protein, partial [Chthoniobacteraceae bacterium]